MSFFKKIFKKELLKKEINKELLEKIFNKKLLEKVLDIKIEEKTNKGMCRYCSYWKIVANNTKPMIGICLYKENENKHTTEETECENFDKFNNNYNYKEVDLATTQFLGF
jgi:hypothetical protein